MRLIALVAAVLVAGAAMLAMTPHSEDALLTDFSSPPPWPVLIGVNVVAGALRSAADALTPPPIKVACPPPGL